MCLGIPARVVELASEDPGIATVDVSGVRRDVSVALVEDADSPLQAGDWVLVHVGFALARIDERQAEETLELLRRGLELERELAELRRTGAAP